MNQIIVYIICFFAVIGGIDKVLNNKFGLGEHFEKGFMAMGSLAFGIIGIYSLAPVISTILAPIITPIYEAMGLDPSIFIGTILAPDMGGYDGIMEIAGNKQAAYFSTILSCMMGAALVFSIPVGIGIVDEKDKPYFSKGILSGIITIPIGCIVGGIAAGIDLDIIVISTVPVIILAALLAVALIKFPNKLMNGFGVFSKFIITLGIIGIILSIIESMTGIKVIKGMKSFEEGVKIVGGITMILSGAYPLMYVINKFFSKYLNKIGNKMKINEIAVTGLLASMVNNIPAFGMMKDMNIRGKVINSAFAVSGAFTFGGQLGFIASVDKTLVLPMIIGKISAGVCAVGLACILTQEKVNKKSSYALEGLK